MKLEQKNIDHFSNEWNYFKNDSLEKKFTDSIFRDYFQIFPFDQIGKNSIGADFGCGTGRFSNYFCANTKHMHIIEPSTAINVAKEKLSIFSNTTFHNKTIKELTIASNILDFGFCLGVLHHTEDVQENLNICVSKLKPGAPFLLYVYYSMKNQKPLYRFVWFLTDLIRKYFISLMPFRVKLILTFFIAFFIYLPFARIAKLFENLISINSWPLSYYRNLPFYLMRNDALDRFGNRIEKRYSKDNIREIMEVSGLQNIKFSLNKPFWCVLGYKKL